MLTAAFAAAVVAPAVVAAAVAVEAVEMAAAFVVVLAAAAAAPVVAEAVAVTVAARHGDLNHCATATQGRARGMLTWWTPVADAATQPPSSPANND